MADVNSLKLTNDLFGHSEGDKLIIQTAELLRKCCENGIVARVGGDEFWVLDDNKRYAGICRQRDLLNPPRLRIIMVDHNEPGQAVGSLEEAELLEILDHHRLGNPSTHTPIKFTVDVVGSTSTLVSEQTEEAGLSAPPPIASVDPEISLLGSSNEISASPSPSPTQEPLGFGWFVVPEYCRMIDADTGLVHPASAV